MILYSDGTMVVGDLAGTYTVLDGTITGANTIDGTLTTAAAGGPCAGASGTLDATRN